MSWIEFDYYSAGYQKRVEHGLNNTRLIISSMVNLWSKQKTSPKDILSLSMDDVTFEHDKLTLEQAQKFLNNGCNK